MFQLRSLRPYALLTVLCALLFLPGISTIPVLDSDEARFAQATRQMIESGDLWDIRFGDRARYKKPHGIYWLQSASVVLAGEVERNTIWPHRMPAVLGAWLAVLGTFWIGRFMFGPAAGAIAAGFFATSFLLTLKAHGDGNDTVLLAAIVLAQGVLARVYLAARDVATPAASFATVALFWVAVAVGCLFKGPIIAIFVGLTAAALSAADRDLSWLRALRPGRGLLFLAAILVPWGVIVHIKTEGRFFVDSLFRDFLMKSVEGQEGHGLPPGSHLAFTIFGLTTASFFLVPAAVHAWRARRTPAIAFCIAWAVPAWLVFEVVRTKLPGYLLPAYPALTIMIGAAFAAADADRFDGFRRWWARLGYVVAALSFAALGTGVFWLTRTGLSVPPTVTLAVAAILLAGSVLFLVLAWRERRRVLLVAAVVGVVGVFSAFFGVMLPGTTNLWPTARIADALAVHRDHGDGPIVFSGYKADSVLFMIGRGVQFQNVDRAATTFSGDIRATAVIATSGRQRFEQRLAENGIDFCRGADIHALWYDRGRWIDLTIYSHGPPCPDSGDAK